jgi:hypothetical protein
MLGPYLQISQDRFIPFFPFNNIISLPIEAYNAYRSESIANEEVKNLHVEDTFMY